jgi:hypothetical protein
MNEILISASQSLCPYLYKIAMAITAACLVLFGDHVNGWIRDMVKSYNFFIRLTVFIIVVTFGYGALTLLLAKALEQVLIMIPALYLLPVLMLIFIIIGIIAEEKKHI